ncbi:hypothetical protein FHS31_000389 [Sphingomonas vulcanisoli]|uniref:Histidine kinase N-terminal 7TM region domain-containing protein n=1 Tax=Sphingomonas vulcanisoli TaxID=1658060 RepID=A0ABX0TQZ1_9SPHN|nr:hypothetical protein [Sphingomonas vulcanisoli]NIJ06807.1 hypothetical protein [Sphingomonas vulcanisoli]
MATLVIPPLTAARGERFFLISAIVMSVLVVAGFSLQLAAGRSSFGAPLRVHIHAIIFFGWVVLYLTQNILAARGSLALHRRLGWLSLAWIPAMVAMGTYVTVLLVRLGHTPFFFQPGYFLIMDPLSVFTFAGLAAAAIVKRRQTQWHRRLMFCGMAILLGPGVGRLIPMPLLIPYAGEAVFALVILFPIAGVIRDLRVTGRVHPAWWWGLATIAAMQFTINLITFSAVGVGIYNAVAAGSPGANVPPLAFPPFPPH